MTKKKRKKVAKKVKAKRPITCGNCGKTGHNARSCKEDAPGENRQLLPHEAVKNGTYWAPYGDKGWSAVRLRSLGYKHAKVDRVKPKTQEVVTTKGKVRLDELIRRDPKLVGTDRPAKAPNETFATSREQRERLEEEAVEPKTMESAQAEQPVEAKTRTETALTSEEETARQKKLALLLDLIDDDATTTDW